MEWQNVSLQDVADSLRQVDVFSPRPLVEFFSKFTLPKTTAKWTSRLKCNCYYFRANYFFVLLLGFLFAFFWHPLSLGAASLLLLAVLCLNDPFTLSLNDKLLAVVKKLHPRTSLRLRALNSAPVGSALGARRRGQSKLHILVLQRQVFALALAACGALLLFLRHGLVSLGWALLLGLVPAVMHASLRSPNLKARLLNSDFKAVWRGYQPDLSHDYTL